MKMKGIVIRTVVVAAITVIPFLFSRNYADAHCDTLDGPVINTARAALDAGDATPILKWVQPEQESEIRAAFNKTIEVRKLAPAAKDLADNYFFETLVRLHRAGEGAPYTGLKPAGEVEPPIAAADKAVESGSADELAEEVSREAAAGIKERFARVVETLKHRDESVEAGREYVEAYVTFAHYVEGLHNTIAGGAAHGGEAEASETGAEHHH